MLISSPASLLSNNPSPPLTTTETANRTFSPFATLRKPSALDKQVLLSSSQTCKFNGLQQRFSLNSEEKLRRSFLIFFSVALGLFPTLPSSGKTKGKNPYDEKRLLEQNKRIQKDNNAPEDFPNFIREGFEVNVVTSENYVKRESGLIYKDFQVGKGDCPKAGQQVTFHYIGYNESGRRIDSTYMQGSPARIRMGTGALVPGENFISGEYHSPVSFEKQGV